MSEPRARLRSEELEMVIKYFCYKHSKKLTSLGDLHLKYNRPLLHSRPVCQCGKFPNFYFYSVGYRERQLFSKQPFIPTWVLFRMILGKIPDAYFIVDARTAKIVDCNESAGILLGKEHKSFIGKMAWELAPVYQLNGQTSLQFFMRRIIQITKCGYGRFKYIMTRLDGNELLVEITASIVIIGEQRFLFCIWRNFLLYEKMRKRIKYQNVIHDNSSRLVL